MGRKAKKLAKELKQLKEFSEIVYDVVMEAQRDYKSEMIPDRFEDCTLCGSPPYILVQHKYSTNQYTWWSLCRYCFTGVGTIIGSKAEMEKLFWFKEVVQNSSLNELDILEEASKIIEKHKDGTR